MTTTSYDIELKKGDTDETNVQILQNGKAADLTGKTIEFSMEDETGLKYTVTCTPNSIVNDVYTPYTSGGLIIPFTSVETASVGIFYGDIIITWINPDTLLEESVRYPSGNDYIKVRVWEAIR